MAAVATTTNSSLESRIAALESRLGISPSSTANFLSSSAGGDIDSRLDRLFHLISHASTPSSKPNAATSDALLSLERDWNESTKLASELDPGSFLSRQGIPPSNDPSTPSVLASISTPMVYRRQEVLASSTFLKEGMDQLNEAREALLLSSDIEKVPLPPQERYTKSSILSSDRYDYAMDESVQQRLEDVCMKVIALQKRSADASKRMDNLVDRYHLIMEAVSEKIVLADEEVAFLEEANTENKKTKKRGSGR